MSRWYLFGLEEERKANGIFPMNLPVDRIQKMTFSEDEYIENTEIEFEEYFDNILGVTSYANVAEVKVEFKVDPSFANYIITKPIHPQQKLLKLNDDDGYYYSSIIVKPKHELYNTILRFGEKVEIVAPVNVRQEMREKVNVLWKLYSN